MGPADAWLVASAVRSRGQCLGLRADVYRPGAHNPAPSRPGHGKPRHSVEAETLINARSSTVWDIITDARNYTVWESGITHIRGELRNGGTIRIRTHTGGNRTFRLRVQQMPGEVMTWTQGLPLGLLTGVRTFTLEPVGGMTHLLVKEEFTGPLCGLLLSGVCVRHAAGFHRLR